MCEDTAVALCRTNIKYQVISMPIYATLWIQMKSRQYYQITPITTGSCGNPRPININHLLWNTRIPTNYCVQLPLIPYRV